MSVTSYVEFISSGEILANYRICNAMFLVSIGNALPNSDLLGKAQNGDAGTIFVGCRTLEWC